VENGLLSPEISTREGGIRILSFFSTCVPSGGNAWSYGAKSSPPHFHTLYYY
jgi:hypothetical protein